MLDRRTFLAAAAAASTATLGLPAMASPRTDRRLIVILQRGGQDGLHAMPAYGDPGYQRLRPTIALAPPGTEEGALRLDGTFGLHHELGPLAALYAKGELTAVPAVATRYRRRSHFDAQDFLENGSGAPSGLRTGFLNRALGGLPRSSGPAGLNVGLSAPLILTGDQELRAFAPSNYPELDDHFLGLLANIYERDPAMAAAFASATENRIGADLDQASLRTIGKRTDLAATAAAIAPMFVEPDGPRVSALESNGWDTHRNVTYAGKTLFRKLGQTIEALATGMAPVWDKTVVLTVSEFGRTAVQNGGGGADHGTGGTMFLAGGAVRGGRIAGEWPGLRTQDLYQERDVYPANAVESVLKATLIEHLGIAEGYVEDVVFPNSREIRPMEGLFRT